MNAIHRHCRHHSGAYHRENGGHFRKIAPPPYWPRKTRERTVDPTGPACRSGSTGRRREPGR